MSWRDRLAELAIAGGMLSTAGCYPLGGGACGNANPDPCICGRPDADAINADLCASKQACEARGGVWERGVNTDLPDGGVLYPTTCSADDAGTATDAGAVRDASGDGP